MTQEELMAWLMEQFQAPPNYTAKGVEKPDSLAYQKDLANWLQDKSQLIGDPVVTAMSGTGGSDPSVFQDVPNGFDEYQVPADPLAPYLSFDPSSKEGAVARRIAEGASPETIAAEAKAQGTTDSKELDRVRKLADDLFKERYQYESQVSTLPGFVKGPDGGWVNQGGGQIVGGKLRVPKMERSKAAQQYDEMGLPTPDQRFGSADFGGGQWDAADAGARDVLSQMVAARRSAKQTNVASAAEDRRVAGLAPEFAALAAQAQPKPNLGLMQVASDGKLNGQSLIDWALSDERKAQRDRVEPAVQRVAAPKDTAAYKALTAASGDWRRADQLAQKTTTARIAQDAYANKMAALHAQAGLTPLTMTVLQRAKALRGMG